MIVTDDARIAAAARRVYDAETVLHAARSSRVDRWVAAAADRLHDALVNYRFAAADPDAVEIFDHDLREAEGADPRGPARRYG